MEIYLVRHTTPDVPKGICYGVTDLDLVDSFDDEAKEVMKQLPESFDVVYASPLKRCLQLAQKITSTPVLDDRLKEMDFGVWEMQVWDEIADIQPWFDDWVNVPAKGGESYIEVYNRAKDFLKAVINSNAEKIAIVSHAGVIRAMNAYFENLPLKNSFDLKLDYGGIIKVIV